MQAEEALCCIANRELFYTLQQLHFHHEDSEDKEAITYFTCRLSSVYTFIQCAARLCSLSCLCNSEKKAFLVELIEYICFPLP